LGYSFFAKPAFNTFFICIFCKYEALEHNDNDILQSPPVLMHNLLNPVQKPVITFFGNLYRPAAAAIFDENKTR
jgi:hypothetical protein